jgi:uncharacterized delta-60 repeat protein
MRARAFALLIGSACLLCGCGAKHASSLRSELEGQRTFGAEALVVRSDGGLLLGGVGRYGGFCDGHSVDELVVVPVDRRGVVGQSASVPERMAKGCPKSVALVAAARRVFLLSSTTETKEGFLENYDVNHRVIARFLPNGRLDPAFEDDGVAVDKTPRLPIVAFAEGAPPQALRTRRQLRARNAYGVLRLSPSAQTQPVGLLPNGDVATGVMPYGTRRYTLQVVHPDGRVEAQTTVRYAAGHEPISAESLTELHVVPRFGIYVRGEYAPSLPLRPDYHVFVYRHRLDATVNRSFGSGGRIDLGPHLVAADPATAFAVEPDGKLLATGTQQTRTRVWAWIERFTRDGRVDHSFGRRGVVLLPLGRATRETNVYSDSHGAIEPVHGEGFVAVAALNHRGTWIFRLTRDGHLDRSFGRNGRVLIAKV